MSLWATNDRKAKVFVLLLPLASDEFFILSIHIAQETLSDKFEESVFFLLKYFNDVLVILSKKIGIITLGLLFRGFWVTGTY